MRRRRRGAGAPIFIGALLSHVFNRQAFIDDNVGTGHIHCLTDLIGPLDWARGQRASAIAHTQIHIVPDMSGNPELIVMLFH